MFAFMTFKSVKKNVGEQIFDESEHEEQKTVKE